MYNDETVFYYNLTPDKKENLQKTVSDGKPLISIITAYYNVRELIEETAVCVFNQTFPYWEWIIVNDGSTDKGTKEFLSSFEKRDPRIKVYHKENEGLPKTRDYAIKRSTTDLLYILDPDDLMEPTFLETGYWSLMTNPEAKWVYSNHVGFQNFEYTTSTPFDLNVEKRENIICGNSIVRKKELLEVGGYSKAQRGVYEDWHLWLRMLAKGYFPIRMNYYGFWYRRREGVLHQINKKKDTKKEALKIIKSLANNVKIKSVNAIQFPIKTDVNDLLLPQKFNWSKKSIYNNKERKQILFILPWLVVGGADNFNLELISRLDKKKYNITIITTEYSKYVLRQEFEKHAVVFDLTTFLKQKDWAGFIDYIIKSRNIDLVFLSNSFFGYYALPWLKSMNEKVKFVDYLHAEDFSWRHGGYPRDSVAISNILDKTYTCTEHLKTIMKDKMNLEALDKAETIYIGVDEKKFDRNNPNIEKIDFSIYKGKKIILFSCRIVELKRPLFIIDVLKKLLETNKNIILFVVGDGDQLNEMKSYAKYKKVKDNVVFFGMQRDVRPYYKAADVLVVSSLTEGLTLSAYEAMSMAVPVVSANVGGQSELIDDSCGKIIKPYQNVNIDLFNRKYSIEEIEEYALAINQILFSKNYASIKDNCRQKILENFTIDIMVEKMSNNFDKLIQSKTLSNFNDKNLSQKYLSLYLEKNPLYISSLESYQKNKKIIKRNSRLSNFLWKFTFWRSLIGIRNSIKWKVKSLLNKLKWESYALFNRIRWIFKQGPKEYLWRSKMWRKLIKILQNTGIINLKKKIVNRKG